VIDLGPEGGTGADCRHRHAKQLAAHPLHRWSLPGAMFERIGAHRAGAEAVTPPRAVGPRNRRDSRRKSAGRRCGPLPSTWGPSMSAPSVTPAARSFHPTNGAQVILRVRWAISASRLARVRP
jgi:hypothetical protein